jgi:hypothetical protein
VERVAIKRCVSIRKKRPTPNSVSKKNIPSEEELNEVVEGWEGKPKGMLHILWERGGRLHAPWQEGCFWNGNTQNKSEASDESSD